MKPNLIVVQPAEIGFDSVIEDYCEKLCETYYVYLIRPGSEFRDDSPNGLRFLNHSLDHLPGFADVDSVIAIGGSEIYDSIRKAYPASSLASWDPENDGEFPFPSTFRPTVVQGRFGNREAGDLARAI